jgi:hypothetical protein
VVILTICNNKQLLNFAKTLKSIFYARPYSIIVVTLVKRLPDILRIAAKVNKDIKVVSSLLKNKRH